MIAASRSYLYLPTSVLRTWYVVIEPTGCTANASGRYFGVYKSLHWQDIYAECKKLLPKMKMPSPLVDLAIQPTLFDFTRRDHLGVTVRDFPTLLRDTIEWIQSDPFAEGKNDVGTF